jgi:hypothetical protein
MRPVPTSTSRKRVGHRRCAAKRNTPSVLVVLPDFDGLLRILPCRFVSPCYRSWGSSCFQSSLPFAVFPRQAVLRTFPRLAPHTLRSFPLRSSRTVSPQSFPSRRCSFLLFPTFRLPTSRLCSTPESVAACRCCHPLAARYSLGLCSPTRFSPHTQMLFRKTPERPRRSGVALDHARRSGRALDVPTPRCLPDKQKACPSQRLYSRSCLPRRSRHQCVRFAGLPTNASLPLSFSSDLSCAFHVYPADSEGVLLGFGLRFKDRSEMRWR